jgi:hypothetical protein
MVPKESAGTLCICIVPRFSSSSREVLLDLIRIATKKLFILYIQLLDICERHPDVENSNHSQYALIEAVLGSSRIGRTEPLVQSGLDLSQTVHPYLRGGVLVISSLLTVVY